ncbi:MAG: hypothetical protein WCJ29_01930 [bacterium]
MEKAQLILTIDCKRAIPVMSGAFIRFHGETVGDDEDDELVAKIIAAEAYGDSQAEAHKALLRKLEDPRLSPLKMWIRSLEF